MGKVIAIINRPPNCQRCWFSICKYSLPLSTYRKGYSCQLKEPQDRVVEDFDYNAEVHLKDCPLRELPEKKEPQIVGLSPIMNEYYTEFDRGYNTCIDEILKGDIVGKGGINEQ